MRYIPFSFPLFFAVFIACQPTPEKSEAAEHSGESPVSDTALAGQYLKQAAALLDSGKYDRVVELSQKAEAIYSDMLGKENAKVADAQYLLGRAWYFKRNYDQAEAYFEMALKTRRSVLGETHTDVGKTLMSLGNVYWRRDSFDRAIEFHENALDILQKSADKNRIEIADVYINLGNVYNSKEEINRAIENYQKSLGFSKGQPLKMARAHGSLGRAYWAIEEYGRAVQYLEQSVELYSSIGHPEVLSTYTNLSICCISRGDYPRAIKYSELALSVLQKSQKKEDVNYISVYNTIGAAYAEMGDHSRAIDYLRSAADYVVQLGMGSEVAATVYTNIGVNYFRQGKDSLARYYYELGIELLESRPDDANAKFILSGIYNHLGGVFLSEKNFGEASNCQRRSLQLLEELPEQEKLGLTKADIYTNMGLSYTLIEDYEKAIRFHRQALEARIAKVGEKHPVIAKSYFNIGNYHQSLKNNTEASAAYHNALEALNYKKGQSLETVDDISSLIYLLESIGYLQRSWYEDTKSPSHLLESRTYYQEAMTALNYQFKTLSPASKSDLAEKAHATYMGALATNHLLHQLTGDRKYLVEGFDFAERSKSFLLNEAIHESNALAFAGIPDTLLRQEYNLRVDIAFYEKKRQSLFSNGASGVDSSVFAVSNKLTGLNRRYEALKKQLESHYPQYYRAKYDLSVINLEDAQQNLLKPHQALLEYFVGDSSIFIFAVRPDTFRVVEVKKDFPLKNWVADMRAGLSELDTQGAAKYARAAHHIYEKIFQPIQEFLAGHNLIIVPDGELGYVPFDALLSATPDNLGDFRTFPYLLQKHQISISYSATLLREMRQKQHERLPSKNFLGIAPYFPGIKTDSNGVAGRQTHINTLPRLFKNKTEVEKIQASLGGDILVDAAATEQAFSKTAGKYRILHLSTHGEANDQAGDYSYLAFYETDDGEENELLFNRELYNLRLNADLVVLSACETGIGELQHGEGIISLARGFSYAGAKSIVTTLWKVEESATSALMQRFYENLQKGMAKDEALRAAKQYLLKETPNANPFYWAAFVPVGDMEPIRSQSGDLWVWLLSLAGIILLAILLWWRSKKVG